MAANAALLRDQAVAAAAVGNQTLADSLFDQAVAAAPRDSSILNSAGAHWSKSGDLERAMSTFAQAVSADRQAIEPAINLAILLTRAGRAAEALDLLAPLEKLAVNHPRYWSVRANAERAIGRKRDSFMSYERAWKLDASNSRAAEGRARLALETGLDARPHYRDALLVAAREPTVVLGFGQAMEAAGETAEARRIAEQLVVSNPSWVPALEWLAQLRWSTGERAEFTAHYAAAARTLPSGPIYTSWCRMLAGVDQFAQAAEVAANARRVLGELPEFALLEAVHAGEAGDNERADAIFAEFDFQEPDRDVQEARHRMRTGDPARVEELAARAIAQRPDQIAAWALRDLAWRLLGDDRHEWLHGQDGLVRPIQLDLDDRDFATVVRLLDRLHDSSSMPVGQSVRDGTQTRGGLFDRHEEELRRLEASFGRAIDDYRSQLPERDETHPLLRHRDEPWRFAGSWSIRAFEGGRHTEHIHPLGIVSSAAYFAVPQAQSDDPQAGWLELGRPPPDLRLDLPPICAIEPVPGRCALFPSTLYHGTRHFSGGKRMTVAVDIHLDLSA